MKEYLEITGHINAYLKIFFVILQKREYIFLLKCNKILHIGQYLLNKIFFDTAKHICKKYLQCRIVLQTLYGSWEFILSKLVKNI